jgi:hypothetical protein
MGFRSVLLCVFLQRSLCFVRSTLVCSFKERDSNSNVQISISLAKLQGAFLLLIYLIGVLLVPI